MMDPVFVGIMSDVFVNLAAGWLVAFGAALPSFLRDYRSSKKAEALLVSASLCILSLMLSYLFAKQATL